METKFSALPSWNKTSFIFYLGKDYFDLQPSWFDTLLENAGCLEVENFPVKAKDLEAMKNVESNSKASTEPAKGYEEENL